MSIIATVIGLVILLIRKISHNSISPKYRYLIWIAFLVALIVPITIPSKISIYNYIDISNVKTIPRKKANNVVNELNQKTNKINSRKNLKFDDIKTAKNFLIQIVIPNIWLIICITKLILVIRSHTILTKGIGNDEIKDERIIKILERCKRKLKIKKNIKIIRQDLIKTPSIMGLFEIRILFTDKILQLDDISINDIIMHELSHYKRKDNILNVFIMIMKAVYWFNPIIKIIFKYIKLDIELATDEMAISKMEKEEKVEYCKVIVKVAGMCSSKAEQVLGISNGVKEIEQRIDMVALKEKFEKYSILIVLATITIILFMCLVLYPTSYGMLNVPRLYLKLENGDEIEASVINEEKDFSGNTIKVAKDEIIKLVTKGGKSENYIVYDKINLSDSASEKSKAIVIDDIIYHFEVGEYIYNFTLNYGNNQSIDYAIKIIVE